MKFKVLGFKVLITDLWDWVWYIGYQDIFGAHTFYLPFCTIIVYRHD